jgi:hypothetical protein
MLSYTQTKLSITGNTGILSTKNEIHFLMNASINYEINDKLDIGFDTYVSPYNVDNTKFHNNQFYAYIEYSNPKLHIFNKKLNISLLGGAGLINYKFDKINETKYSTLLASKINYRISNKTTIGLKQGFLINPIDNSAFVGLFINYSF